MNVEMSSFNIRQVQHAIVLKTLHNMEVFTLSEAINYCLIMHFLQSLIQ